MPVATLLGDAERYCVGFFSESDRSGAVPSDKMPFFLYVRTTRFTFYNSRRNQFDRSDLLNSTSPRHLTVGPTKLASLATVKSRVYEMFHHPYFEDTCQTQCRISGGYVAFVSKSRSIFSAVSIEQRLVTDRQHDHS